MNFSVDLSPFLVKIWDATAGELKHLRRPKPRIEELKEAITELSAKEEDIDNKIRLAELQGEIPTKQVDLWLGEVKDLKGKAAATEQDFESRRFLGDWSWNCFSVNRRVAKRMDNIHELMTTNRTAPPVTTKKPPSAVVEIPISDSTFGMEAYKSEILGYIASPNAIEVIGIYGMGGAGKTTLLKSINNHRDISTKFDHVIWAVASRECKMEKLQKDIAKWLGLHLKPDDSTDGRAAELYDFLKNKDCLLLLDDLWESLDLEKMGMVNASSGQGELKRKVVVFTTRFVQVCGDMNASREMRIKCLKPEEAWLLFRSKASGPIGSDPGIERIARQIAEECAGLPLALITVGMALSRKKWEAWNNALTLMKHSQIPQVTGKKEEDLMFYAFKLSYDMLQDEEIRGCLLSCALWPEDHSINKEELIKYWMGLGLINEDGEIHKTYNEGYSHIETLKAACLLEPGNDEEREVKMHDVIRDMALWMACDCGKKKFKWIVSRALEEEGWHEAERVSLMYNDIASLPNQLSTCSKLSVLMLQGNRELKEIHGTHIQAMRSLTYLDLSITGIAKIPKEIRMFSQLQHLNLSYTLIQELPAELGNLVNLKYLFLRNTFYLTAVAKGAISNLSLLRLLDLRESRLVHYSVCWDELEGLKGCLKSSIGIDIRTSATLQRLYSLQHVLIWRLRVSMDDGFLNLNQLFDNIMKSPNARQSMEQLEIGGSLKKELLISKGNEEAGPLECLEFLSFSRLFELEEITWKAVLPQIVFPNLRELRIDFCSKLKNVNWVLQLPSLIVLVIDNCYEMVELTSDEGGSSPSRVGLREMTLNRMKKLTRISRRPLSFPNLEKIEVRHCPLLRKLPPFAKNRLKVIQCEQKWWDNLEWEDVSIKNSLWPLVTFGKNLVPIEVEHIPTSLSKVGIEECMGTILDYIASANSGVIGVYGIAGVGKTTLLCNIKNHRDVYTKFDSVILAVATKEYKMKRLQMDIANRLFCMLDNDDTEKYRSTKLFDSMEDKNCLLLLDDLWAPLDLTELGMARVTTPKQRKQKRKVVVFTTRNKQVCDDMNVGMRIEIKCLEPVQAWDLFQRNAGEDTIGSDAGIEHMAHKIVEECAGFPLALSIIGKAMSTKKSSEAWNDALTQMKQLQMEITGEKEAGPLFSASKISYDSLEDDDMRARLLSCALWPKDLSIKKDELIECWMGLGLIDVEGMIHEIYNRGHSHIEILKAAFLLESGKYEEQEVKMHDVIRDMALWVASDKFKWILRASRELEEEGWHKAERVSLMYNDIASLPNQLATCSKLSVLILRCNKKLKEIRGTLIQAMRSLTYLDLNNTRIIEISKEIGMLPELRYLNLNKTPIRKLPAELGNLVNLKYLFLRYTRSLTVVAKGAISNLSLLRLLDLRESLLVDCSVWDELKGLKGCPKSSISIDIRTANALQGLCSLQHALIWQLNVNLTQDEFSLNELLDDIMKSRNTREGMEQLKINSSKSKELLISKVNEEVGGFECLKYLDLSNLYQLEEITWKGLLPQIVFPNLQELTIWQCNTLKNVNWTLQLPSLRVLKISHCRSMKEIISDEGILDFSSFGLRRMTLFSMRELKRISQRPLCFPYLEEIEVRYCSLLRKLPFPMNKLKVIQCEQKWWDNLEWEDVSIKNSLLPFVSFGRNEYGI